MKICECICNYCGHRWVQIFSVPKGAQCLVCKDKSIRIKPVESGNVYGYPEEEDEEQDDDNYWTD